MRRFGNLVQCRLPPLGVDAGGDVPEAPDPADCHTIMNLRARNALIDPAIIEMEYVKTLGANLYLERGDLGHEFLRFGQLGQHEAQHLLVVAGVDDLARDVPHSDEALVEAGNPIIGCDHQDAIIGRFERGAELRDCELHFSLGGTPKADACQHFGQAIR